MYKRQVVNVSMSDEDMPPKKSSVIIYVVQPADTLWKIAKKYLTTVKELMDINDIEEKEEVKPNQKLIIPGRAVI